MPRSGVEDRVLCGFGVCDEIKVRYTKGGKEAEEENDGWSVQRGSLVLISFDCLFC